MSVDGLSAVQIQRKHPALGAKGYGGRGRRRWMRLALAVTAVGLTGCVTVTIGDSGERLAEGASVPASRPSDSVLVGEALPDVARLDDKTVTRYPRVKFALIDDDGSHEYFHGYSYDEAADVLGGEWSGSETQYSARFDRGSSQVGLVPHETGLEIVVVGVAVVAAAKLVHKLWERFGPDAEDRKRGDPAMIYRCEGSEIELKARKVDSRKDAERVMVAGSRACK